MKQGESMLRHERKAYNKHINQAQEYIENLFNSVVKTTDSTNKIRLMAS